MENKNVILVDITDSIIKKLQERISNIDNQIDLISEEAKSNWNGQKTAYNEAIKIVQNEFMKKMK